jgi:hypothetical protein
VRDGVVQQVRGALGGIAVAVALPPLLLHVDHQPGTTVHVGSVGVHVALSDLCVVGLALAGLAAGLRWGFAPLRAGRAIWIASAALLVMVAAATLYGRAVHSEYHLGTHAVTAAKFALYALIAVAVPLLVRSRLDLAVVAGGLVAWSAAATTVALMQFFGADVAGAWSAGRRQPSFLGHHDFAALSGASLAIAFVAVAAGPRLPLPRALTCTAGVAGTLGLVLSGSSAGAIGVGVAALATLLAARAMKTLTARRIGAIAGIVAAIGGGVLVLRGGDFDQFLRWLGVRTEQTTTREDVQSYAQHTLLAYLGIRIFLDHPLGGVGWQASGEYASYKPYLGDAHRRFPRTAEKAFPSPDRPYGVQNVWIQALADLGVVGFAFFAGLFATALVVAASVARRARPLASALALACGLALLIEMGVWSANGLVAGIPMDALLWLALGLIVTAAGARDELV